MRALAAGRVRGARWRLAPVALWLAVVSACALPPVAAAHGGYQIAAGTDGPYGVVVRARPYSDAGRHFVDVTSYVVRQSIGEPDLTTSLAVRLAGPDGPRTLHPRVVGDGYEAIVPVRGADDWRHWTIDATVTGGDGTSHVHGAPLGAPAGAPSWLVPVTALLLAAAAAVWWRRRRRQSAAGAVDADPDDWSPPAA